MRALAPACPDQRPIESRASQLLVAPLEKIAARYRGLRCDGMHYGSWIPRSMVEWHLPSAKPNPETDICDPHLGAYYGMLVRGIEAHLAREAGLLQGRPVPMLRAKRRNIKHANEPGARSWRFTWPFVSRRAVSR